MGSTHPPGRYSASLPPGPHVAEAELGATMDGDGDSRRERGKVASAISNAIVGLHRDHYGRGADRTRTVIGSDYVIVFMEGVYTPVERTLIDAGRFDAVAATRTAFQATMK